MAVKSNLWRLVVAGSLLLGASAVQAADTGKGAQIYQKYCVSCHGIQGMAEMPGAPHFALNERLLRPDAFILRDIQQGKNAMPAFQGILESQDILDVIAYIRTLAN